MKSARTRRTKNHYNQSSYFNQDGSDCIITAPIITRSSIDGISDNMSAYDPY